ncbi:hypothetical protein LAUMK191_05642 [Mycobacterium attenuatum]|nr:hypothetical protein LAUMK191_05642 [Mycobacterium attenuatum]
MRSAARSCERENLYSSLLTEWRYQRDRGALEALSSRRGPKPGKPAANAAEAEIARLRAELDTAREVIRVQVHCNRFFRWYNHEHKHSGIGLHVPADVHYGRADEIRRHRASVLDTAYRIHPERFIRKPPQPPALPTFRAINSPSKEEEPTR